jgi:hypothetical protein
MSVKALRHRIERRLGAVVDTIDLRAIGVDTDGRHATKKGLGVEARR